MASTDTVYMEGLQDDNGEYQKQHRFGHGVTIEMNQRMKRDQLMALQWKVRQIKWSQTMILNNSDKNNLKDYKW